MRQCIVLFCVLFFWSVIGINAQHNCYTLLADSGQTEVCRHTTGQASTIRYWDSDKRNGYFEAFSSVDAQLVHYDLRNFGGHASVSAEYYSNGQVSKLEYSSAPDGGIQFWRIIHHFDESGNETLRQDLSQPDGHPRLTIPDIRRQSEWNDLVTDVVPAKQEPQVAVTVQVMNLTGRRVSFWYRHRNDSTERAVKLLGGTNSNFIDTQMVERSLLSGDLASFRFEKRASNRYELRKILISEHLHQYALLRRWKRDRTP